MSVDPVSAVSSLRAQEGERDRAIVQAMLAYEPCPDIGRPTREGNLDKWGLPREIGDLLLADPNAFLIGCLFNYQIRYVRAFAAPLELHRRLGHLDVTRLAEMSWQDLAPFIAAGEHGRALHRFPNNLAKRVVQASRRLVQHYQALASNIWPDGTRVGVVLRRLRAFHGISQKISNMMARMLVTSFGVRLTNWEEIDVAVDRHVARVFLRTGLVARADGAYGVPEVADEVIGAARTHLPRYPGHLDSPAFTVGLEWCRADRAYCDWAGEGGPCPLRATCRRRTNVGMLEPVGGRIPLPCQG